MRSYRTTQAIEEASARVTKNTKDRLTGASAEADRDRKKTKALEKD